MKRPLLIIFLFLFLQAGESNAQSWKQYADSAAVFLKKREQAKALDLYLKTDEILKKDSALTLSYFFNLNVIGDILLDMGQYPRAEPYYLSGKELIERLQGKENAYYAISAYNLGRLYRLMGQYAKAEPLLTESRNTRARVLGKENVDYANSCNILGIVYVETGRYAETKALYEETREIRERILGRDHIDYAAICNNIAILYYVTGKPAEAEPLFLEAKRIREKVLGREHPVYAASLNNLAIIYLSLGQYKKAEPYYIEARQIREKTLGKEHPDYAASCDNLAVLYMDTGKYAEAEALYKEARQIREKSLGTKHVEYAKGCNNLALLYKILGQYEKSLALFSEARDIIGAAVGREHFEYGICCNNLGAVYMDMSDYGRAAALYEEARQLYAKVLGKEHNEYAKACHNLALVHLKNGSFGEAETLFTEANLIREKVLGKEHIDFAEGCDNLGTLYTAWEKYDKAIALHSQAKQIRAKALGNAHPDYLQSCINLANDYRLSGNDQMALNLYTESFSAQQELLRKIFHFTTEPEKQAYLKKVNEYRDYFLSFGASMPGDQAAVFVCEVSLANKNLVVNASQRLRRIIGNSHDTTLQRLYASWTETREQLAFWYSRSATDRAEEISKLEERAGDLEKELNRLSADFRNGQLSGSWKEIREALQPGEAAVEFSSYGHHDGKERVDSISYLAIIIRKDKPAPQVIRLFEKEQLGALAVRGSFGEPLIRKMYAVPGKQGNPLTGNSLYSLIWKPMERFLEGVNTIYFSPAGDLYKVSFAALPVSGTQLLSDKFKLVQLNSTASLHQPAVSTIQKDDELALFGGVQYTADTNSIRLAVMQYKQSGKPDPAALQYASRSSIGGFNYLAGTEQEVKGIGRLAAPFTKNIQIATGIKATEESIKGLSGKNSPAILHIATHGFFFPDPSYHEKNENNPAFKLSENPLIRSGLVLAGANNAWRGRPVPGVEDGILTAYEVSNMYLPTTKLAVLSACETGLGDIQGSEGVFGLQRAFRIAGAENLLMSLWKVPDSETAEFMQEFYRQLFSGQTIQQAFYLSQSSMKNKYRNDPYKWGAWVLVR